MKKSAVFVSLFVMLVAIFSVTANNSGQRSKSDKPRIAVLEFTAPISDDDRVKKLAAREAQNLFVSELVKTGKFRVVEREQLEAILRRENLPLSGDIDKETAVKIGKLLGVNYVATGAVTEYGVTDKSAHGSGAAPYAVAIKIKLSDATTGEKAWDGQERSVATAAKQEVTAKVMKPCIQKLTASLKAADL